jgi:hypothetical protein
VLASPPTSMCGSCSHAPTDWAVQRPHPHPPGPSHGALEAAHSVHPGPGRLRAGSPWTVERAGFEPADRFARRPTIRWPPSDRGPMDTRTALPLSYVPCKSRCQARSVWQAWSATGLDDSYVPGISTRGGGWIRTSGLQLMRLACTPSCTTPPRVFLLSCQRGRRSPEERRSLNSGQKGCARTGLRRPARGEGQLPPIVLAPLGGWPEP